MLFLSMFILNNISENNLLSESYSFHFKNSLPEKFISNCKKKPLFRLFIIFFVLYFNWVDILQRILLPWTKCSTNCYFLELELFTTSVFGSRLNVVKAIILNISWHVNKKKNFTQFKICFKSLKIYIYNILFENVKHKATIKNWFFLIFM